MLVPRLHARLVARIGFQRKEHVASIVPIGNKNIHTILHMYEENSAPDAWALSCNPEASLEVLDFTISVYDRS